MRCLATVVGVICGRAICLVYGFLLVSGQYIVQRVHSLIAFETAAAMGSGLKPS